jgi:predicted membrane-bound spermidine synthase
MDMVVVFGALFVGLTAAVAVQILVHVFNMKSHAENLLVGGTFAIGMLVSAPIIANIAGV